MTRIGLLADVHGNLVALRQVLSEFDSRDVDAIWCLGDVAVLGPQPDECVSLIRERGISTVCGNTDAWLVEDHPVRAARPDSDISKAFVSWTAGKLTAANLSWLKSLPAYKSVRLGDDEICLCHGSPASPDDIIVNMSAERVGEFGYKVLVGGHTHQQVHRQIRTTMYINPGSCGLPGVGPGEGVPIHKRPDWLQFVVIEHSGSGIDVTLEQIPADIEQMTAAVQATDMPEQLWWRSLWA
jgi:putative phosphoesterase